MGFFFFEPEAETEESVKTFRVFVSVFLSERFLQQKFYAVYMEENDSEIFPFLEVTELTHWRTSFIRVVPKKEKKGRRREN